MTFAWMNHIMKIGYKRPLTKNDVWKLDIWDQLKHHSIDVFVYLSHSTTTTAALVFVRRSF
uniref:Uncharacterized protein n=1 Tax=Cucumis melo TaxID=3656 RepID=A0A9I9EC19_CUCME